MPKSLESSDNRDFIRLACFILALLTAGAIFLGNPALTLPTLCAIVLVTLFSPWVKTLERRGFTRMTSIGVLFSGLAALMLVTGFLVARNWQQEWVSFQEKGPEYFTTTVEKVSKLENRLKASYPVLENVNLAAGLSRKGSRVAGWFSQKLPGLIGDFFSCLFLVPILTFCLLSEGRTIQRSFFRLVPNRFFESVYSIAYGVSSALSDYLRAKLIEAFLVGALTTIGLALVGSPYAIVLGAWAGVTNIIPYIGPFLGAVPAILIAALDEGSSGSVWTTVTVFGIANLIDTVIIFPGIVAKLVKLNPLILVASVVLGQYYYGIIGMLISIPIAAAIKVVLSEFYVIIYGFTPDHE